MRATFIVAHAVRKRLVAPTEFGAPVTPTSSARASGVGVRDQQSLGEVRAKQSLSHRGPAALGRARASKRWASKGVGRRTRAKENVRPNSDPWAASRCVHRARAFAGSRTSWRAGRAGSQRSRAAPRVQFEGVVVHLHVPSNSSRRHSTEQSRYSNRGRRRRSTGPREGCRAHASRLRGVRAALSPRPLKVGRPPYIAQREGVPC